MDQTQRLEPFPDIMGGGASGMPVNDNAGCYILWNLKYQFHPLKRCLISKPVFIIVLNINK